MDSQTPVIYRILNHLEFYSHANLTTRFLIFFPPLSPVCTERKARRMKTTVFRTGCRGREGEGRWSGGPPEETEAVRLKQSKKPRVLR